MPTPHGDNHDLWIDPHDNQRMIEGNDGGACVSFNGGATWSTIYNQPTAQFYHVIDRRRSSPTASTARSRTTPRSACRAATIDGAIHERTGTRRAAARAATSRSSRTTRHRRRLRSGRPARLQRHHDPLRPPHRPDPQHHRLAGAVRLGRRRREPQVPLPVDLPDHVLAARPARRSTSPATSSSARPTRARAGRSISPDLTRNDPDKLEPSGGPITRDNTGAEVYCTIFAFAESPHRQGVLWAGTDDGLVHSREDGGADLAERHPARPAGVGADQHHRALAARRRRPPTSRPRATSSTTPRPTSSRRPTTAQTWTQITNGIPDDDFTRVIREDPNRRGLLYAGTETGHLRLVRRRRELAAARRQPAGRADPRPGRSRAIDLVVATHGRSFWILDDLTPLHQLADELQGAPRSTSSSRGRRSVCAATAASAASRQAGHRQLRLTPAPARSCTTRSTQPDGDDRRRAASTPARTRRTALSSTTTCASSRPAR